MKRPNLNTLRKTGRILMMSCSLVMAAGFAAGSMLEANADQVNNFLNTRTTRTVGTGKYDSFTPDEAYLNKNGSANTAALVEAHKNMGIRLAEEGSVLLKNNGALPLATSTDKVTLMGYRSAKDTAIYGMDIGSPEEESQNVSFRDALKEVGFDVNATVCDAYDEVSATSTYSGSSVNRLSGVGYYTSTIDGHQYSVGEPSINEIKSSAGETAFNSSISAYKNAGIVVLGRPASEAADYYTGNYGRNEAEFSKSKSKNVLSLSDSERELLEYAKETFDKVVVIINTSNAMELGELEADDGIDAILWAGYPGNYGFIGVSNILAGKANPSGKLADVYAADTASAPAMQNWSFNLYGNQSSYNLNSDTYFAGAYVVQAEGIYTGYKYYETRYEDAVLGRGNASSSAGLGAYATGNGWKYGDEVTYSFGFGLSYTKFTQEIKSVEFSSDLKTATVNVTVKNDGNVAGKSVVQVYGQSPYTDYDKTNHVEKAAVQLLAFEKIDVAAGATEEVAVEVDMQYFASYDSFGYGTYIMEQSEDYYFALGCNPNDYTEGAHAAINNILASKGKTTADGMDADGYAKAVYKFGWTGDVKTFSTSKAGVEIENQLDDADYNYYKDNTVTYLSRQDWSGTWPQNYSGMNATDNMITYLQNSFYTVSKDDDVSEIVFGSTENQDINFTYLFNSDFDDERWAAVLSKVTLENAIRYTAAGNRSFQQLDEIYFLSNGSYVENGSVGIQKSLSQQSDSLAPWFVSTGDENASYSCNSFVGAPLMASCWNKELMYELGELWGNDALFINIPMVWAPSINLHRTAYNGRNGEYYSEDPVLSGYTALNIGTGALSKGLITSIKHFAFNVQETSRLGLSTFMNEQTARENELRGFQIALEGEYNEQGYVKGSSVIGIMTAYNRVGATYAGAHTGLMQGILRGEWDYNGYATSDLAQSGSTYMPYIESILAGTTNFDATVNSKDTTVWRKTVTELATEISGDAKVLSALKEDLHYSLWAFSQSNLANWMTDTTRVVWAWNWWRGLYQFFEAIGGIAVACGLLMYLYAEGGYVYVDKLVGKIIDKVAEKKKLKEKNGEVSN